MKNNLQIEITKSWRKTLSMRFDRVWVLQIKAPKFTPQWSIDNFISKNQSWIEKQGKKLEKQQEDKKWYLFGEEIVWSHPQATTLSWILSLSKGKEAAKLTLFYKSQAKNYIPTRCQELADLHGFTYNKLRITSATSRWGSCSSKRNLNFSYRLIMAPREAIDYVIIHELCHLRQMNHSAKFWKEVSDIMPEYKQHEKHLRDEGWKYKV